MNGDYWTLDFPPKRQESPTAPQFRCFPPDMLIDFALNFQAITLMWQRIICVRFGHQRAEARENGRLTSDRWALQAFHQGKNFCPLCFAKAA